MRPSLRGGQVHDRLLGRRRPPATSPLHAPLAHDEDPIGRAPAPRAGRSTRRGRPAPCAACRRMISWISNLAPTSTPLVGSSSSSTRGARRQPLRERRPSAGCRRSGCRARRRRLAALMRHAASSVVRLAALVRAGDQHVRPSAVRAGSTRLCRTERLKNSPCRWRSSGTSAMPGAGRLARVASRTGAPADADRRPRRRVQPEDRLEQLGAARADQAEEPDDLAARTAERHVVEARPAREPADAEHRRGRRRGCAARRAAGGRGPPSRARSAPA